MRKQVEEASDALNFGKSAELLIVVIGILTQGLLVLLDSLEGVGLDHDLLLSFAPLLENVSEVHIFVALILVLAVDISLGCDSSFWSVGGGQELVCWLFDCGSCPSTYSEQSLEEIFIT